MEPERTITGCFSESTDKSFAHQEPSKSHHSASAAADARPSENLACFDCSICLDSSVNPVVTLCSHLYCWPCIYKWLQVESASPHQCPVCKSPLSQNTLVPLYGRGSSNLKNKSKGLDIPNRPAVLKDVIASVINEQHLSGTTTDEYTSLHRPMQQRYCPLPWGGMGGLAIAILPLLSRNGGGEMYFSRLNQLTMSGISASQRMRERRVENSLHQIWAFLFCGAILCLLFF